MTIVIVSGDLMIERVCREVLGYLRVLQYRIVRKESVSAPYDRDLYIWDFVPDLVIPPEILSDPRRHVFLVDRKDLDLFGSRVTDATLIILKPVSRSALAIVLQTAGLPVLRADRDELLQCLIQANLRLQEYDHDRTNFLARAVHQIRTPLTAVTGYCGLLASEQAGSLNADQKQMVHRMSESIGRASRLAAMMLELSVTLPVERTAQLQPGDFRECVETALEDITPLANEKQISITVGLAPSPEPLWFERRAIQEVLVNLLENACKFTRKGGAIDISGHPFFWERRLERNDEISNDRRRRDSRLPNCYRLNIRDTGPGISKEHLPHIFEEYASYNGATDRSGAGLGLAISRMIISRHQGRIWAENTASGALFSFVIPFQRPAVTEGPCSRNGGILVSNRI